MNLVLIIKLLNKMRSTKALCLFFLIIYLFMIVTQRERGRDTGRGRSRLHAPGARRGIRSQVSRIAPWAKGRRQTAAPPRDPKALCLIDHIETVDWVSVLVYVKWKGSPTPQHFRQRGRKKAQSWKVTLERWTHPGRDK